MSYENIATAFYTEPWAITQEKLDAIARVLDSRFDGGGQDVPEGFEADAKSSRAMSLFQDDANVDRHIAVVPLHGTILNRAGMFSQASGMTSPQKFAENIDAAIAMGNVTDLILDVDSPGGTVAGTEIAAEAVRRAKDAGIQVHAIGSGSMTSAAYWIASQAHKVYTGETTAVGSIGVLMAHRDMSGAEAMEGVRTTIIRSGSKKALGNSSEALSAEARQILQEEVDAIHAVFVKTVAEARGFDDIASNEVFDGSVFIGRAAIDAGLVDGVASVTSLIETLTSDTETAMSAKQITPGTEAAAPLQTAVQAASQQLLDREQEFRSMIADLSQQLAEAKSQIAAYKNAEIAAYVDSEIIGKGRAVADSRDTIISKAEMDFDFVKSLYEAIPVGAVAPVGGKTVSNEPHERKDAVVKLVEDQLGL